MFIVNMLITQNIKYNYKVRILNKYEKFTNKDIFIK